MTAHLLSVTLQTNLNELLTSLSFLVVAIIILSLFFFWWRNVSDNDLDLVKEADANQVTGPAITGAEPPEHVQAEAEAIAEQKIIAAAASVHHEQVELPEAVIATLSPETVDMVEAEIAAEQAESAEAAAETAVK